MALFAGVGYSQNVSSIAAIDEAYAQAILCLEGNSPSFILLYASATSYDQQVLLQRLQSKTKATIIGCSTAGEITSTGGSLDKSVALMAIYSDRMKFIPGVGYDIQSDARKAGKALAENIQKNGESKPKAVLMMPDGLAGNGADIVRGVLDVFGHDFMVAGGSAGDDYLFKQTYQYYGDKILSGSVVGVGLFGAFSYGIGVRHGWIPIGTPQIATKSKNNILYELNGRPAIEMYEAHFGKDKVMVDHNEPLARLAITYPLGIPTPNKDGYLIRDPITVDENGAITCAAEIPEGSEVYLMIGSREEAIEAASDAARKALAQLGDKKVKAILLFNCIARKKLLMSKKHQEIEKIRAILGNDIPLIGFYTYGEQAPLGGQVVTCSFHNETDVIFLLAE